MEDLLSGELSESDRTALEGFASRFSPQSVNLHRLGSTMLTQEDGRLCFAMDPSQSGSDSPARSDDFRLLVRYLT